FSGSTTEETEFFWSFPDAPDPGDRIHREASPTIRLPVEPGQYGGSVTLTNACTPPGDEDSLSFTYTVIDCDDDPTLTGDLAVLAVSVQDIPGGTATFRAEVMGPVAEYTWDFGDGATPRISRDPAPTVTLGIPRAEPYVGTLVVGNACRSSEVFFFNYRVDICREGSALVEIRSISPAGGPTGTLVQFTADIVGTPASFAWDFGGGATPNTSDVAAPAVELGDPGTYVGELTVRDRCGEEVSRAFSYTVGEAGELPEFMRRSYSGPIQIRGDYPGFPGRFDFDGNATVTFGAAEDCYSGEAADVALQVDLGSGSECLTSEITSFTSTSFSVNNELDSFAPSCNANFHLTRSGGGAPDGSGGITIEFDEIFTDLENREVPCTPVTYTLHIRITGNP
ncbi:MAG TPA: hypothetical protein VEI97_02065, partial [bacterium]|nr:hypothetical protein [bacterium]